MPTKTATLLITCVFGALPTGGEAAPDFARDIRPILEANCVRCHKEGKAKGGLRMDTRARMMEGGEQGEAIVPGKPEDSELVRRTHLRPIDEDFMPDEGQALGESELALVAAWVKAGAPWPEDVTLVERITAETERVALPDRPPRDLREAAAMLDDILKRANASEDVLTTPVIGDDAFLRRATIDLIGRIPTMKEIALYEGWGEQRREVLVSRLLEDPRFADRWTIFFADLLRIRSNVAGGNELLAYVHSALESGKPYDVMTRELIGASGRPNVNPAVGYLLGDNTDPLELAAATSQVFLGVRIGCAMCHDHPFDDWEQKDFYDLAAFFGKTRQARSPQRDQLYTTEGHETTVLWPPESMADPEDRRPVQPEFPFALAELDGTPHWLARFERNRKTQEADAAASKTDATLEALLDAIEPAVGREKNDILEEALRESKTDATLEALLDAIEPAVGREKNDILEEALRESRALEVLDDVHRASELRNQLAELVASPRNPYFARAFVNRVWAELIGHGFVEPLDNFSAYNELRHPSALDFLAQEFVASGYDLRSLITIITLSDAYRRSHLAGETSVARRERSEKHFTAAPVRRMLAEVLYDSVVVAGHLDDYKWPAGANLRELVREIRVPTGELLPASQTGDDPSAAMTAARPIARRADGYDLESTLALDFEALLDKDEQAELEAMRMKSDEQIEAETVAAMAAEQQRMVMQYRTEEVVEVVDDNPRFGSAMRMATPAPPAHFLRVFGQPARDALGQFRDEQTSLRQQLMMMNGRLTHEASRVGPKEPLHRLIERKLHDRAIDWAYQEILTRYPTTEEKAEARALLNASPDPFEGMADLRWALLNSHEFRYLP